MAGKRKKVSGVDPTGRSKFHERYIKLDVNIGLKTGQYVGVKPHQLRMI